MAFSKMPKKLIRHTVWAITSGVSVVVLTLMPSTPLRDLSLLVNIAALVVHAYGAYEVANDL